MRHIKTDWRNRLQSDTLSDLMRILLEGSDIESFDPTEAIHLWYQGASVRKRRVDFTRSAPAVSSHSAPADDLFDPLMDQGCDTDHVQDEDSDSDVYSDVETQILDHDEGLD